MLPPADTDPFDPLIEHAIELSAQWHDRTYRKGAWRDEPFEPADENGIPIPVMAHVTTVAITLARAGWDAATVAAAFLHDVLEDEDRHGRRLAVEHLRKAVGDRVTDLVVNVTETKNDESGRKRDWRARKEGYLDRLAAAPDEAVAISLADKLHNLWSINRALERGIDVFVSTPQRRALTGGPTEQLWFNEAARALAEGRDDERLRPIMRQFDEELATFRRLAAERQK
ncbi:MAG TPA: HD domain-containing protein [Rhodothermales bacterium]